MARWIVCGGKFDVGDVVRWTEGVWHEHGRRRKKKPKLTRLGTREVTAQVLSSDPRNYVQLSVMKCEILENRFGGEIEPLKKKLVIKRKRATIAKGDGVRLAEPPEAPARRLSKFAGALRK